MSSLDRSKQPCDRTTQVLSISPHNSPSSKPLLPCLRSHGTLSRTCMCASRQGICLGSSSIRLALPRGSHAPSNAKCSQVELWDPTGINPILGEHQRRAGWCHELWLCLSWAEESHVRSSKSLGECRNVCGADVRERKAPLLAQGEAQYGGSR